MWPNPNLKTSVSMAGNSISCENETDVLVTGKYGAKPEFPGVRRGGGGQTNAKHPWFFFSLLLSASKVE